MKKKKEKKKREKDEFLVSHPCQQMNEMEVIESSFFQKRGGTASKHVQRSRRNHRFSCETAKATQIIDGRKEK
jgi:hypothetical protein